MKSEKSGFLTTASALNTNCSKIFFKKQCSSNVVQIDMNFSLFKHSVTYITVASIYIYFIVTLKKKRDVLSHKECCTI